MPKRPIINYNGPLPEDLLIQTPYEICKSGYDRFKKGGFDKVSIRCFNKEEVLIYKRLWEKHFSDVPVSFTWMEWG